MKYLTRLLWVAALATILIACGDDQDTTSMANDRTEPEQVVPREDVSWVGTYRGVLPCESGCLGEETMLELRPDNTYTWMRRYKGKDEKLYTETSDFEWDADGDIITLNTKLVHPRNNKQRIFKYRINSGYITKLDHLGEPMQGVSPDRYRLVKAGEDSQLKGRYYRLVSLGSSPLDTTKQQVRQAHLVFSDDDNTLNGSGGCNRLQGEYQMNDTDRAALRFGKVVATEMACDATEIETELFKALERTASYRLEGDRLQLMDEAGKVIAELEYSFFGNATT